MSDAQAQATPAQGTDLAIAIERKATLDPDLSVRLRRIYLDAFEPMRTRSAMRIVMTDDEWTHLVADDADNLKLVGTVGGEVAGVMVVTNRPDRIEWLEPAFLQDRYPEAFASRSIWYILTVCVDSVGSRSGLFRAIVDELIDVFDGGVLLYDTCEANTRLTRVFGQQLEARGIDPAPLGTPLDVETFYAFRLDGSDRRRGNLAAS
jgi:hypothetical protein